MLLLLCGSSCHQYDDPQFAYDHAYHSLLRGDLKQAQQETDRESQHYRKSNAEWAWKFRILEARALLQRSRYEDALALLKSSPIPYEHSDLAISVLTFEAEANIMFHKFLIAEGLLAEATQLCTKQVSPACGYVYNARGLLAVEQKRWDAAEKEYELSLEFARSQKDSGLESNDLNSLANVSLAGERYDEAIDRSEAAYEAKPLGALRLEFMARTNKGWAQYKLGNLDSALELFLDSERLASQMGDPWNQANELTDIGYIQMDEHNLKLAGQSFRRALELAQAVQAKGYVYNALRVLARLSLQIGDLASADNYDQQALAMAREENNHFDELYPSAGPRANRRQPRDNDNAKPPSNEVEQDKTCPVFLKWEAEHSLARLYETENRPALAKQEYRAALATFESARDTVRHEDSQLSFLTNASRIYDDYIHFLVAQKKTSEALRSADYSRARTLAEGLGLLNKKAPSAAPNPQQLSRRAHGAILFYWLGESQSYLWAITPQRTDLFTLPARAQIEAARAALSQIDRRPAARPRLR